jgi:hypothetical protein
MRRNRGTFFVFLPIFLFVRPEQDVDSIYLDQLKVTAYPGEKDNIWEYRIAYRRPYMSIQNVPSNAYVGGESLRPSGPTGTIWNFKPGGGGFLSWRLSKIALTSSLSSLRIVFMMVGVVVSMIFDGDVYKCVN